MINIGPASLADLDAVMRLEEASFSAGERWGSAAWSAELDGDHRIILAARTAPDGPLVGAITVARTGSTADLMRVVVDPDHRRQQIGRRLVDAALEQAQAAGVVSVMLEVRYDNEPAIALYQGAGFEQLGIRHDYYGPGLDALVLKIYDLSPTATEPGIGRHVTKGVAR